MHQQSESRTDDIGNVVEENKEQHKIKGRSLGEFNAKRSTRVGVQDDLHFCCY